MAIDQVQLGRQHELGMFLRSRRERLLPEQVGLPNGERRRTPGLRRGEVAQLAGVSLEWYTWLEQGRDINVSVQVLERLAGVLHLESTEREHLFPLALRQPAPVETFTPPTVSATVQHFLDQLALIPACAVDARLNIIAWNAAHRLLFGFHIPAGMDDTLGERDLNLIWRLFSAPAQQINEDWEELARIYLAQFRAGYGRFINDLWWAEQIEQLSELSPTFRKLWPLHDVRQISEGRKTLHHPVAGTLHFDFLWLQSMDSNDVRLLLHTPRRNTATAETIRQFMQCNGMPT